MTSSHDTAELLQALDSPERLLRARWLYDDAGSATFEAITELPEYYPTRVELGLLRAHAQDCASITQAVSVTELGCGASPKTHALIDGFAHHGLIESFTAMDVHEGSARNTAATLSRAHPGIEFIPVAGDFTQTLPVTTAASPQVLCFLGSTIGNLTSDERGAFLISVARALHPGDFFLVGIDLVKDPARILAAYDDTAGITRRFILNALTNVNHLTGAAFTSKEFDYAPSWNPHLERIEMRARARKDQRFTLGDQEVLLPAGDSLLVEISTKFRIEAVEREFTGAGLAVREVWTGADEDQSEPDFALLLAQRQ